MRTSERIRLHAEDLLRFAGSLLPAALGMLLRRCLYRPFFHSAGAGLRVGHSVMLQGLRNISLGNNVGLNRHSSLYAARGGIKCGDNVFVGDFSSINANDAEIIIGSNVAIGPMTLIQGANHNFDRLDMPIIRQGHAPNRVEIGDDVWIAARVVILPGVKISGGAVIAAGAVVNKDVPAGAVMAGVPAKVIRMRGDSNSDSKF